MSSYPKNNTEAKTATLVAIPNGLQHCDTHLIEGAVEDKPVNPLSAMLVLGPR